MTVLLQADRVRVEFGSLVAVRDVSFELSGGQLLGLVGPNGAGKTTLLRVLAGLHAPTRGAARIMGRPVLGKDEVVRQHVGFGPDAPPAYEELTIQQYLSFIGGAYGLSRETADERIDFWLDQLWLADKRHSPVKHLSRGMRQRVTLARTFLPQPHVILLDEPLSGLDPGGRIELRRILTMLCDQGCAMIVSSHILSDLEEVATHVAIIEHGRILRWAATAELVQHDANVRTFEMVTAGGSNSYNAVLTGIEGVTGLTHTDRSYRFDYRGDDAQTAELLRRLVAAGIPIISFQPVKTSLEDAYLRSGVKQVD